jgi:hypothetical protein
MKNHTETFETVTTNTSGRVRKEYRDGREWYVAPMTMIVPGVLPGSKGPLFYPSDEIEKNPSDWNGVPITIYHPTENGVNVSARSPRIMESQGVGYVYHTRTKKGKLQAEGWFDAKKTRQVDSRVADALEDGRELELSTGLFTTNDPAEDGASYKSRPYTHIARNYKPDHLAVLPDQKGACSIADGCGVLVNTNYPDYFSQESSLTGCDCGGTCNSCSPTTNIKRRKKKPSSSLDMSPSKACKILKDKEVNGHPLTERQRGMFGALCSKSDVKTNTESAVWKPITPSKTQKVVTGWKTIIANAAKTDLSYDQIQMKVAQAFREYHPPRYDPSNGMILEEYSLVSVFPDYVIYAKYSRNPTVNCGANYSGDLLPYNPSTPYHKTYRQTYVIDGDKVEFDGEPEEVQQVTTYQTVS